MTSATLHQKDIHELQRLALASTDATRAQKAKTVSRAALLDLIDILSRWSAAGLALIAGISIVISISVGRDYPARSAAWIALLLCALWVCRRMHSQFRSGGRISARPFRWRASYTCCLSVLGVIFASAPILLMQADTLPTTFFQLTALVILGAFGAALLHSAHFASAAAFAIPIIISPALAALRIGNIAALGWFLAFSVIALVATLSLSRLLARNALRRHPRTKVLRREVVPENTAGVHMGRQPGLRSAR